MLDKIADRIVEAGQDALRLGIPRREQQLPSSSAPPHKEEKEKGGRNGEQRVRGEEEERGEGTWGEGGGETRAEWQLS